MKTNDIEKVNMKKPVNNIINKLKKNKMLVLVALAYVVLLIVRPDKAVLSGKNSIYYIKEMLLIMPVVFILTALIEAWVPKETIMKSFGDHSGIKGSVFSFLLGSFSAGPIYAAFPICKMLLKKGASISNIVIILSSWAVVKVPMLANEAKFLGPKFMAVRWVLTTISIFIMAYMVSKVVKKDSIPLDDVGINQAERVLSIKHEYCIGCGVCAKMAPDYFELENGKAFVVKQPNINTNIESDNNDIQEMDVTTKQAIEKTIENAIEKCPSKVISW